MTDVAPVMPTYSWLMLPVLRAVQAAGGSATSREIKDQVMAAEHFTDEQLAVIYPGREPSQSILMDRMDWAKSYCKLTGVLESPKRNLYLISALGHEILALDDDEARSRLQLLDREVRSARQRATPRTVEVVQQEVTIGAAVDTGVAVIDVEDDTSWTRALLARLHRLTPQGFEEFCLYLLRQFGMELTRRGGPGDEGIDGIGTVPLSEVLSATVAVQVKRYDPGEARAPIGRDTVALFQRDAMAAGAERAILITLGRFSAPARKAAVSFAPKVDLIDGDRLCDLVVSKGIGVKSMPVVDEAWFNRFE